MIAAQPCSISPVSMIVISLLDKSSALGIFSRRISSCNRSASVAFRFDS